MIHIGLICAAGISSRLIIAEANSQLLKENSNITFEAITADDVSNKYQIILLTPQVEYLLQKIKTLVMDTNIKIAVIPSAIYANNNIKKLIKFVKELLNTKK